MESTINEIYTDYLENIPQTEEEGAVAQISTNLDEKIIAGSISSADLADYEEAARHAGFNAGFQAAMEYIRLLKNA